MLNTQDQQDLVSHEVYGPLIKRVARQVTRRSNSIYGFRILDADDVTQDVFIQLTKTDIGVAGLDDMRTAEGWLRRTARFMAQNAIDKTIGSKKDHTGRRVGRVDATDFHGPRNGADDRPYLDSLKFASMLGIPEAVVDDIEFAELLDKTRETIRGIIDKVQDPDQREALVGYYLRGEKQTVSRVRKRRWCGQRSLTLEDVASLQAWRAYNFPDAKHPPASKAEPQALKAVAPGERNNNDSMSQEEGKTMRARITAIRPFDSYVDIEPVSLDLTNDEGAVFNVIVSAESVEVLIPVMNSESVLNVPNWLLLPFPPFDPDDA